MQDESEKKVNFIITIIIKYAWISLNKTSSEYATGSKYAKILNMAGFSLCERYKALRICQNMPKQSSEYILGSKYARILNMAGSWICKKYAGF